MRVLVLSVALALAGCDALTIASFGASDGVPPFWYQEAFSGLPPSFTPAEWPDGTRELRLNSWQTLTVSVATLPDGDRVVKLGRDAFLLDAALAVVYRDFFGADKIRAIRGMALELVELRIAGLDRSRAAAPTLAIDGVPFADGAATDVPPDLVVRLRDRLLAGEEVRVPFTLEFRLQADDLDALPDPLDVFVKVQPTLYVDLLAL